MEKVLSGKRENICKLKKKKAKYCAHCPSMHIHVVDLDETKRTYSVVGSDVLGSIENKTADDTGMDVADINMKNALDLALGKREYLNK